MSEPMTPDPCPKCGNASWHGPVYKCSKDFGVVHSEWLDWKCDRCGYEVETDTLDAKPKTSKVAS